MIWFVVPLLVARERALNFLGLGLGIFDFAIVALGFLLENLAGILFECVGPSITILIGAIPVLLIWIIYQFGMRKHNRHLVLNFLPQKPHRFRSRT